MHSGASASRVKHDAIEGLVTASRPPRGIVSLLAPVGPRGRLRDAEEGLGGEDPVPLDVGDVDEQAHTQSQGVRHLHHLQVPIVWYFSHFFVCEVCAGHNGRGRENTLGCELPGQVRHPCARG